MCSGRATTGISLDEVLRTQEYVQGINVTFIRMSDDLDGKTDE